MGTNVNSRFDVTLGSDLSSSPKCTLRAKRTDERVELSH